MACSTRCNLSAYYNENDESRYISVLTSALVPEEHPALLASPQDHDNDGIDDAEDSDDDGDGIDDSEEVNDNANTNIRSRQRWHQRCCRLRHRQRWRCGSSENGEDLSRDHDNDGMDDGVDPDDDNDNILDVSMSDRTYWRLNAMECSENRLRWFAMETITGQFVTTTESRHQICDENCS